MSDFYWKAYNRLHRKSDPLIDYKIQDSETAVGIMNILKEIDSHNEDLIGEVTDLTQELKDARKAVRIMEMECGVMKQKKDELQETMKQGIFSTHKMNTLLHKAEMLIEEYVPEEKSHALLEEIFEETNLLRVDMDEDKD